MKNESMTEDINRDIRVDYIQGLNLPKRITFPERYIVNGYFYDGVKYSKTRFDNNSNLLEEEKYFGNLIIRNGRPHRILHDEGYVDLTDLGEIDQKNYHIKDHLGNVRVVIQDYNNSYLINQVSTYFPFGMVLQPERFVNSQDETDNTYLYNGKEQQEMPGGWYDYGARFYDPQLGRFHTVDRFAEKYFDFTPYQYGANNPINVIDINGDSTYLVTWATDNGKIGHAGVAVDNYKTVVVKDQKGNIVTNENGNTVTEQVPDGTVTYYDLWPASAVGKSNADENVTASYNTTVVEKGKLLSTDVTGSEGYAPDGVISIGADYNGDKRVSETLNNLAGNNKDYNGYDWNCSTYAREGVNTAANQTNQLGVKGFESIRGNSSVTPNQLFKDTRKLQKTNVLKDPGKKVDNSFIKGVIGL